MIGLLRRLLEIVFRRRRRQPAERMSFRSQKVAFKYCLAAMLFFGLQGIIANVGALDLVIPDLPSPIPFEVGRAIHLTLSIYWPVLGTMGAAYYFFIQEAGVELYSVKVAEAQFWLFLATGIGALTTLMFGITEGREYLEVIWPLDLGTSMTALLFLYNLSRTYMKPGVNRAKPVLVAILLGAASLVVLFVPNMFFYAHQTMDEVVKFWVVHMWEELSLELISAAVIVALIASVSEKERLTVETVLYVELGLVVVGASLATGHHYYWVGVPGFWLWVGGILSVLQVIPIFLLVRAAHRGLKSGEFTQAGGAEKLSLGFAVSSVFYHVAGAGGLGLMMAIPSINLFTHGTYLTSAHAHLALFGAFGLLVIAGCYYVLAKRLQPTSQELIWGWRGLALINIGLLMMGGALVTAGLVQTYLWRITGIEFMEVHGFLRPFLALRAAGGALFAAGDVMFLWTIVAGAWRRRRHLLKT